MNFCDVLRAVAEGRRTAKFFSLRIKNFANFSIFSV